MMIRKKVTITLGQETFAAVEMLRGQLPRSYFIENLILEGLGSEKEKRRYKDVAGYQ